jgi:hypothetical protein
MAEKRRSGRRKDVPNHPLVEALASDPSKPPGRATKLFGLPGPATDADSTRLWLDDGLTTYVDVPSDAILHSQTLENDRGTVLWVDSTATLTYSSTRSQEVQADFLGGKIAERNLAASAPPPGSIAMAALSRRGPLSIVDPPCLAPITLDQQECPSFLIDCTTPVLPCPVLTVDLTCPISTDPSVCRETIDVPCPSTPRAGCPPAGRGRF